LSDGFLKAIRTAEVATGGMKAVELGGRELVVCNCAGVFYAIDRRCGHMSAPLEQGTLDGTIVTCAMHCAQFDVTTGEALSGPVPPYLGGEVPHPRMAAMLGNVARLMRQIRTEPIGTYPTKVEGDWVWVAPGA
jgi:nitrite reductase/ring-hydroxylating ferredoxin subunit